MRNTSHPSNETVPRTSPSTVPTTPQMEEVLRTGPTRVGRTVNPWYRVGLRPVVCTGLISETMSTRPVGPVESQTPKGQNIRVKDE